MNSIKNVYLQKLKSIDLQTNYFTNINKIHTSDMTLEELQNDLLEFTISMLNIQINLLDDDSKAIINLLFFDYDNFQKNNNNNNKFDFESFANENNISINQVIQLKEYIIPIYNEIIKMNFSYDTTKETYLEILPKICEFLKSKLNLN